MSTTPRYLKEFLESVHLSVVLDQEGGLVDHPSDPGGLTNMGISLRAYPNLGRAGITALTREQAGTLYWFDYWTPLRASEMPPGIALAVFDSGVNQGVAAAKRMLQTAAGVKPDGILGPKTLKAVAEDPEILPKFLAQRALKYSVTKNWQVFKTGWMNRLMHIAVQAAKL